MVVGWWTWVQLGASSPRCGGFEETALFLYVWIGLLLVWIGGVCFLRPLLRTCGGFILIIVLSWFVVEGCLWIEGLDLSVSGGLDYASRISSHGARSMAEGLPECSSYFELYSHGCQLL